MLDSKDSLYPAFLREGWATAAPTTVSSAFNLLFHYILDEAGFSPKVSKQEGSSTYSSVWSGLLRCSLQLMKILCSKFEPELA